MAQQQFAEEPVNILIADAQAVVRRGLGAFLAEYPSLRVVGEAHDGPTAAELGARLRPDVVLLDLDLPLADWLGALQAIREASPATKVIGLTSHHNDELAYRALEAGAIAYHLKDSPAPELARAIVAAHLGHPTLAPEATESLVRSVGHPPPGVALTPRERDVLTLMIRGLSNPAIAEALRISPSTVKFHVSSILGKLGTSSRTQTVAVAVQRHLVE